MARTRAFDRDEVVRPRLHPLLADDVAPDAIIEYFTGLRAALLRPDSLPAIGGCLLISAAGTPIANDPIVADTIAAYRSELHSALHRGVVANTLGIAPELVRSHSPST